MTTPTKTEAPMTWTRARSVYAVTVREHGRDSAQAKAAEATFWTVRLCALVSDTVTAYPLSDEQRQAIANTALTAGR